MSTVYLLGAGASYGYTASPTGVRPPLATGLFKAFFQLDLSGDLRMKIGWLVNYVRDRYGIPPIDFASFEMDAEEFMTTLESDIDVSISRLREGQGSDETMVGIMHQIGTFNQTLFLFTNILNDIVNGPLYDDYVSLATRIGPDDAILTFNWDVLLDRALYEVTKWQPDTGYGVDFESIFDEGWRPPTPHTSPKPALLKLHGSTNWLTPYITRDPTTGQHMFLTNDPNHRAVTFGVDTGDDVFNPKFEPKVQERPWSPQHLTADKLRRFCFISGRNRFDAYNDRFRAGYAPFTYFYSPLDPTDHAPTSPLIIAPVRHKAYDDFSPILEHLWARAAELLHEAHRVVVVGFSFPPTDVRVRDLFKAARFRRSIEIVNPYPDRPLAALNELVGTTDDVRVVGSSFSQFLQAP